ncbi:MAG: hypothetical protein EBZ59_07505 [Planctomycetia bacterium]|nr:hypothetical protein [Planctomycetia bacterium]
MTWSLSNPGANNVAMTVGGLVNFTGTTGAGVIAADGSATYGVTGLVTNVVGVNQTLVSSATAGDLQSLSGASPLQLVSATTTYTVLDHSNAAFSLSSGGGQTIITGGTLSAVSFNLTNLGTNLSPLDVQNLANLSGATGSGVVASGGTASYAWTGLTGTAVGYQSLSVSLDAGDDQNLSGANPLQTYSGSASCALVRELHERHERQRPDDRLRHLRHEEPHLVVGRHRIVEL